MCILDLIEAEQNRYRGRKQKITTEAAAQRFEAISSSRSVESQYLAMTEDSTWDIEGVQFVK